jgi:hypothetical protein
MDWSIVARSGVCGGCAGDEDLGVVDILDGSTGLLSLPVSMCQCSASQ